MYMVEKSGKLLCRIVLIMLLFGKYSANYRY